MSIEARPPTASLAADMRGDVPGRRWPIVLSVGYVWARCALVLASTPFVTPDTASYRSGQGTRPPASAALLSSLGDTGYVLVSALVSSAGFLALCWALWEPTRRRASTTAVAAVVVVSLLPLVVVYEHWLVPDSLLVGLSLLLLSVALRLHSVPWAPWLVVGLSILVTLSKEVGVGVVLLVVLVLAGRGALRLAAAVTVVSVAVFALVVLPGSSREGRVFEPQPLSSELTMERVRVIIASMSWADVSADLADVRRESERCGMTRPQLLAETFGFTDNVVDFSACPGLWDVVDEVSQFDLLVAHAADPTHVPGAVSRGFAADMGPMAYWSGSVVDVGPLLSVDRLVALAVAALPFVALAVALARRRGRWLAAVALVSTALAVTTTLLDPSSQERHALPFRVVAFALALASLLSERTPIGEREVPVSDVVEDLAVVDAAAG